MCEQFLYFRSDVLYLLGRFKAWDDHAALVGEELGEVPFDVSLLLIVGILFAEHVVEDVGDGVFHIPSGKSFLLLQELVERVGIGAVYLEFLESGELRAVSGLAEVVDGLVGSGSLLSELVTGKIKNLKSLAMIFLVEFFQFFVLWCETTFRGCVDDEEHFVGILLQ